MKAMKLFFFIIGAVSHEGDARTAPSPASSLRIAKRKDQHEAELIQVSTNFTSEDDVLSLKQLEDPRYKRWPSTTSGWTAWGFAALFVLLIAQIPFSLHFFENGFSKAPPLVSIMEGLGLFAWLTFSLFLFTQVIKFQSPHFGDEHRPLTLIEAVYLFSQIFTTVGYGDITPAYVRGQVTVGFSVFIAIMLIADMVSQLSAILVARAEAKVLESIRESTQAIGLHNSKAEVPESDDTSVWPVLAAGGTFWFFVLIGTLFFHYFPGEGKTIGQGIYMSIITLTTVGFGAFTPVTEGGMVFGAFWMLFGVSALGALVASFTAWTVALKKKAHEELPDLATSEALLRNECADSNGMVDKVGYIKYVLCKRDHFKKEDIENIIAQFDAFKSNSAGKVEADQILKLSAA